MRITLVSSFIAIAMIATVFLGWAPEAKGQPPPCVDCCNFNLDRADCFCAGIWTGRMRQVECTSNPGCGGLFCDCQIGPVRCHWWETGKVLERFIPDVGEENFLPSDCFDCGF